MAFTALLVTQFLAAGLLLALAFWLLWVDFTSRINRAFALFLVLDAMPILIRQFLKLALWPGPHVWDQYRWYVLLGVGPSIAYFFLVYNWRGNPRVKRTGGIALLAYTIVVESLYATRHALFLTTDPDGRLRVGDFGWMTELGYIAIAASSAWFALQSRKATSLVSARFHRLVALGFIVLAIEDGMISWSYYLVNGFGVWTSAYVPSSNAALRVGLTLAIAPIAYLASALLVRASVKSGDFRPWGAWILALGAGATAVAFIGAWKNPTPLDNYVSSFLVGVARLVGAGLLAYAIVRQRVLGHKLFTLDLKVRLTIKRSTLAAIFFAAFFVIGEASQLVIQSLALKEGPLHGIAPYIGILGAGLLMFAFQPLQRWAERVSRTVVPDARPLANLTMDERATLYRQQAEIAWLDGTLTIKERRLLDQLQARLGLDPALTARLESRAAMGRSSA